MSEPRLQAGQVVADRFVVESVLGVGGLAEVYKVRHRQLGSVHALKVLTIQRRGFDERLRQEGRIQAQLRHPNVVSVTDIVEVDGQPGLVMEFVEGPTLEELTKTRGGRLPYDEAMAVLTPVLAAVANAHAIGVVHRDLKPANILLQATATGFLPKVVDFGIGKMIDSTDETNPRAGATRAGMAMGTPGYISPEQVRDSSTVDQRTDVFALGIILYELVAGRLPYANPDGSTDITTTLIREAPPLRSLVPTLPQHADLAIRKAIEKEPEQRHASVLQFAAALGISGNPAFADRPTGSLSRPPLSEPAAPTTADPPSVVTSQKGAPPAPAQMSRGGMAVMTGLALGTVAVLAAGVVLVLMVTGLLMFPGTDGEPDVPAPDPIGAVVAPSPMVDPAPVSPDPPPEPGAPDPASVAAVEPGPAPTQPRPGAPEPDAPVPAPQPDAPVPEPGQPEPAAPDPVPPDPVPPEPVVAPDPVTPAPVTGAPDPVAPEPVAPKPSINVAGRWTGDAGGRRVTLTVSGNGPGATGELVLPPNNRIVKLTGTYDPSTGELHLKSSDNIRVDARATGSRLDGSYAMGSAKAMTFSLAQ